jgi:hypothetical protein
MLVLSDCQTRLYVLALPDQSLKLSWTSHYTKAYARFTGSYTEASKGKMGSQKNKADLPNHSLMELSPS